MNPYVVSVIPLADFLLEVTFENGEVKLFDVKKFLHCGEFARLKDQALFKTIHVVAGSVEWLGGLDLSYDTLYVLGRTREAESEKLEGDNNRRAAESPKPFGAKG